MDDKKLLADAVQNLFPSASAAIVYGSFGSDWIPGVSDTDVLIIGPKDVGVEERLEKLHASAATLNLDPMYLPQGSLERGVFMAQALGREYGLHKFDLYRAKHQGAILFGDPNILGFFPDVSLDEALADTLPHVREVFIPKLQERLRDTDDANQFLRENPDIILVISRALYAIETKQYGSKIVALEHVKGQHPEFASLAERVRQIYLKQPASDENIRAQDVRAFLSLAERTIDDYLGS